MRYAVCNELFGDMPLRRACAAVRRAGFEGLELAPYTVFGNCGPAEIRAGLAETKAVLQGEGLAFAGFHWLMARPEGLHFAALDPELRRRARDHLLRLVEVAGEFGGGNLVLGSPRQRSGFPGRAAAEAKEFLVEALAEAAPAALACGSRILIEQLSPDQSDVVSTMEEAAQVVDRVGSAGLSSMFDFHNAASETAPWAELVSRFLPYIGHVHLNEIDGRAPGTGASDYAPAWEALVSGGYSGWASVEIFEVPPEPEPMLRAARELFRKLDEETHGAGPRRET